MKEPKFTGMKKNHAAVFVGADKDVWTRIRIIHSQPIGLTFRKKKSIYEYARAFDNPKHHFFPCWADDSKTVEQNIVEMKAYDKDWGRETIFLGYVKDAE